MALRGHITALRTLTEKEFVKALAARLSPDQYRKQTGRCPDGYRYDAYKAHCVSSKRYKGVGARIGRDIKAIGKTAGRKLPKFTAAVKQTAAAAVSRPGETMKQVAAKAGGVVKKTLHSVWHEVKHVASSVRDLATKPEVRKKAKASFMEVVKKETGETKQMLGVAKRLLKGEKVSDADRLKAAGQAADLVRTAVVGAVLTAFGHELYDLGPFKAMMMIISPADEIAGVLMAKPIRYVLSQFFGKENAGGWFPSAAYAAEAVGYKEGDEQKLMDKMFDAVMGKVASYHYTDADLEDALAEAGYKSAHAEKLVAAMNAKSESVRARMARLVG